jgi:hypothetical protein
MTIVGEPALQVHGRGAHRLDAGQLALESIAARILDKARNPALADGHQAEARAHHACEVHARFAKPEHRDRDLLARLP